MDLEGIRERLLGDSLDAFLVSKQENIQYLSGFTGSSAFILVGRDTLFFVTDPRYQEQASLQVSPKFDMVILKPGERLSAFIKDSGFRALAVEDSMSLSQYHALQEGLGGEVVLKVWKGVVEGMRRIKDLREVEKIGRAVALAQEAFYAVEDMLRPGMVERDLALELEFTMRRRGAEGVAFPFILASGPRSAMPHGEASDKVLEEGDLVVLDFGARWEGYHSDMTRTFMLGPWKDWAREIYRVVLEAQEAALEVIRPGVEAKEVDAAARGIIQKAGYGDYFGHGLGHGVGLEVHEAPALAPTSRDVLEVGMVFTVEPGIYLPGRGGVRIEDLVYLGEDGLQVLTSLPKEVED